MKQVHLIAALTKGNFDARALERRVERNGCSRARLVLVRVLELVVGNRQREDDRVRFTVRRARFAIANLETSVSSIASRHDSA